MNSLDIPVEPNSIKGFKSHIEVLEAETDKALRARDKDTLNALANKALLYGSCISFLNDQHDALRQRYGNVFTTIDYHFLFEEPSIDSPTSEQYT